MGTFDGSFHETLMDAADENHNRIRVLLIEDDPADVEVLAQCVRSLDDADYVLETAGTLKEGLMALAPEPFDVILLDLRLPDAQGTGLIRELRLAAVDTPVVVLTGTEDEELARRCVNAGAQDYLTKAELHPSMLRRAIGFAIARAREVRIRALQRDASRYIELSSQGSHTNVTSKLSHTGSVRDRSPESFLLLSERYFEVLQTYVRQLLRREPKPRHEMSSLVTALGNLQAGPRDLVDMHLSALHRVVGNVSESRARTYTIDGRLLALEMMGLLVDHYRVGVRSFRTQET